MVNHFDRLAPKPVVNSLELYTRWVGQLGSQRPTNLTSAWVRRWSGQMALNVVLIAAVFIAAAFAERHPPGQLASLGLGEDWLKAVLWLAAMIISLPMLIATFRKLQALGLLVAEAKVTEAAAGERVAAIRAVVAQVVPIAGAVALGLFVLGLSSALLPSFKVFMVLLAIVGFITWLLWRSFIKVYSKAQLALQETLAAPSTPRPNQAPALPALLREADLETISLAADSPAVGKLIRELQLRTRTGASIVGFERNGINLINPGPDEELQAGDQVLLLGTRSQLDAARAAFVKEPPPRWENAPE